MKFKDNPEAQKALAATVMGAHAAIDAFQSSIRASSIKAIASAAALSRNASAVQKQIASLAIAERANAALTLSETAISHFVSANLTTASTTYLHAALCAVKLDPEHLQERKRRLDEVIDRIKDFERRNPKDAAIFDLFERSVDEAICFLKYIPPPAHRPKGLTRETARELKRMGELLASGEAKTPGEAARRVANRPGGAGNRAKYLAKVWKEQRGKK